VIAAASTVVAASIATGVLTLVGAGWAAWWLPRLVPRTRPIPPRTTPGASSPIG
jgi:hypothetical protein